MKLRDRATQALRETGIRGLTRRTFRNALAHCGTAISDTERRLLQLEFERRITNERRELLNRNRALHNLHRGQRAFVIGNGPSLKQQNIETLGDQITFAVNAFFKHPVTQLWAPTYYFVTDGLMFENSPGAHGFFQSLRALDSTFFAPLDFVDTIRELDLLPASTHYLALNGFLSDTRLREVDLTKVLPSANSVVQTAMMAAIYMGFEEIVLLGCDHDWLDDPQSAGHFYAGKTADHLADNEENPLISDYFLLVNYVRCLWQGYMHVGAVAKRNGVRIVNATPGGRLDLFERAPLQEFLS